MQVGSRRITVASFLSVRPGSRGWLAAGAVALFLAAAWLSSMIAGGSQTVLPHLFYVPVIIGSFRFGWTGAVATATLAGLLAGPVLPADVANDIAQPAANWAIRLLFFLGAGLLIAWLTRHPSPSVGSAVEDWRAAAKLRTALRRHEICVYYQPITSMETGRIVGVEALARWDHPTEGLISPEHFIPVAERNGMIGELDQYVLREASRQISAWSRTIAQPIDLGVNVSTARLSEPSLVGDVAATLEEFDLPAERLHLEITETAVIGDVARAAAQIAAVRELGVRIAIDDFGVGQTSLSHFHEFVIDIVKIDRSFIVKAPVDPQTARLVAGIINLCRAVGAVVVAEGISNAEEHRKMQALGCELGQGYYLGRPLPPAELERVLNSAG